MRLDTSQHSGNPSGVATVLTWLPVLLSGFQHCQLPHQQGNVLQQITVGQQELPYPSLRFDPCCRFGGQLVLEQLHLWGAGTDGWGGAGRWRGRCEAG